MFLFYSGGGSILGGSKLGSPFDRNTINTFRAIQCGRFGTLSTSVAIESARREVKLARFPDRRFSVPSALSIVLVHGERQEGEAGGEPGSRSSAIGEGGWSVGCGGNAELS